MKAGQALRPISTLFPFPPEEPEEMESFISDERKESFAPWPKDLPVLFDIS
jgi:hypothetical protein